MRGMLYTNMTGIWHSNRLFRRFFFPPITLFLYALEAGVIKPLHKPLYIVRIKPVNNAFFEAAFVITKRSRK